MPDLALLALEDGTLWQGVALGARGEEGLVGLGEVGQHHLLGYASTDRARLVAVADLSDALTDEASRRTGARRYRDADALIADPEVDAVDISLPHHLHLPVTTAALARGKHVLVEKPMGLNVADCDRMKAARCFLLAERGQADLLAPHVDDVGLVPGKVGQRGDVDLRFAATFARDGKRREAHPARRRLFPSGGQFPLQ